MYQSRFHSDNWLFLSWSIFSWISLYRWYWFGYFR